MIEIITGDLLNATEKYIAHQTNCVSDGGAGGIARVIFDKYPYADCYIDRTKPSMPGTIDVRGNGTDQRLIINLHGQYYPGGSKYPLSNKDGSKIREHYFHQCLLRIAKMENLGSIAFPFRIGCGIAGGIWQHYLTTLTNFASYVERAQGAKVSIYQREGDE